ncbi:hypothetical protein [Neobacillus kokaensis]|uniref:Uncharacterized protein n=1 Tax=Neobacillus kokaensis TaxID=2759023 RepID=A0ABQ3NC76_9BACI|nr:hypothetical protein [Neobacillus kokaensis]GHI01537.1 hypothetical protein AM1BK_50790 [Neobacillus kokaensis]
MEMNQLKKGEEKGFVNQLDQKQEDFTTESERMPEFDEIGTALNEI